MDEERLFPLEKILTVSAGDYVESKLKKLNNYSLIGIHSHGDVEDLARIVPKNAEVVVNYRAFVSSSRTVTRYICYGTALIPKK